MYYGDEKIRQMARSLLPSCARKGARLGKRHAKKKHKYKNREILRSVLTGEDYWDGALFSDDRKAVRYVVRERQGADKVGPFVNWVTAKTKDMRQIDRKSYVRGLLPDNLIGYHAMTHLPYKGFDHPNVDYVASLPKIPYRAVKVDGKYQRVKYKQEKGWSREELYILVRQALEDGFHARMNKSIKHIIGTEIVGHDALGPIYKQFGPTRPRLCLGLHDVESFVDDVLKARYGTKAPGSTHPEWLASLTKFLKSY